MTAILGISAFYHDSAAALIVDGRLVAAAQEERFTRKKHDPGFPSQAVAYCLREAGIEGASLDAVVFYEKPFIKFERLLETYLAFAPRGFTSFRMALPRWLNEKINLRKKIRQSLDLPSAIPVLFVDHHESHAASAFFPSPFEEAAILTLDGVGEWSTTTWGTGKGNRISLEEHLTFPHSLGLLYSAFTYYCGFKVNSGEYKLMGLAPYGKPVYAQMILDHLMDLKADGSFRLEMKYFNYCQGLTMTSTAFHALFGGVPRDPESMLEQRHMDLAASIQAVTEEVMLRLVQNIHAKTGLENLVLAGGVALNCVANGRLLREGPFRRIWIQPAAGDAGGALGAALFAWHQILDHGRVSCGTDTQQGSLLGPGFSQEAIEAFLSGQGVPYTRMDDEGELLNHVCCELQAGHIVGWFQGRMEFGPRALGARSILGDARNPTMQSTMNMKIKYRESFRPFAPIVMQESASTWFDIPADQESPYMLVVAQVAGGQRLPLREAELGRMTEAPDLRHRVNIVRSKIPAVTHVDYSARLQTVDADRNPLLHKLMGRFLEATGCPVLVNTSFNVRGEPIVCTPADALNCFMACEMDILVIGRCVLAKPEMAGVFDEQARTRHLAQFQLD